MGEPEQKLWNRLPAQFFRHCRLELQPNRRLPRNRTRVHTAYRQARSASHGYPIRIPQERQRGDHKPLFRNRVESEGRGGLWTYSRVAGESGENEVCEAFVRYISKQFPKFLCGSYRRLNCSCAHRYKQLAEVDRDLAVRTFEKSRDFYHPICRAMVEKDLFGKQST